MRVSDKKEVYVLNRRGKPLMPCSPQKANRLKAQGKAKVVRRTPYTIQLLTATGESKQPVVLGVDSGYLHVGLSAVSGNKELYVSEVQLRTDMVKLNSERRQYRRARRYRNTWYRQPRNVREYVLYRDGHKCTHCHGKSGDKRLEAHHVESRQTGGDRPGNYRTLCKTCHDLVSQGKLKLDAKPPKGFRAETFMSMVRWKIIDKLKEIGLTVSHTYGYVTKLRRLALKLPKSHVNDAFVIAGGSNQPRNGTEYLCKQVRKCNRKLFKGAHSHIKNTAPREVFGFRQWDKVLYNGQELFIKGRRLRGAFALSDVNGKLVKEVSRKKISLVERAATLLIQRRVASRA